MEPTPTSRTAGPNQPPSPPLRLRTWGLAAGGFAIVAALGLAPPLGELGWRVLALVVVFHLGVVVLARSTRDTVLWRMWIILAPMSVLMVLPDWFLSAVLQTLYFPDTGSPFIGTVPVFMAGMWTIALMPVVVVGLVAAGRRDRATSTGSFIAGAAAAGFGGLVMFFGAELLAPAIPLWEPTGVAMTAEVAGYVLIPEIVLSAATFAVVATSWRIPPVATASLTVLLPFTYTGLLATSYQFLG
ncbi:MAG: hypothetical protein KDC23_01155 [Actinobacteria bacterium]|nr:hypothetical protein [Actinomycetota bacterium]